MSAPDGSHPPGVPMRTGYSTLAQLSGDDTLAMAMVKNVGRLDLAESAEDISAALDWLKHMVDTGKMPEPVVESLRRVTLLILGELRERGIERDR